MNTTSAFQTTLLAATATLLLTASVGAQAAAAPAASAPAPLAIGETFTMESRVLGETRRINVYSPPTYQDPAPPLPTLYMPDGGIHEDFLHIAGLLQISALNGTMRPFRLVGIENTRRRRDLTGPTDNPLDREIAPVVGGSAEFRRFVRDELMPLVEERYATTGETAIMGESLAGLFIVETFFLEPDLFDTYIAFDPSLWWADASLLEHAQESLSSTPDLDATLFLANSGQSEIRSLTGRLTRILNDHAPAGLRWHHRDMPDETHATLYHPAALLALRALFAPPLDS